jgi:hypothetical protein
MPYFHALCPAFTKSCLTTATLSQCLQSFVYLKPWPANSLTCHGLLHQILYHPKILTCQSIYSLFESKLRFVALGDPNWPGVAQISNGM